jgi:hypothetical protein
MSGRRSRDKGARTERAIVRLLLGHGLPARKVSAMYKRGGRRPARSEPIGRLSLAAKIVTGKRCNNSRSSK